MLLLFYQNTKKCAKNPIKVFGLLQLTVVLISDQKYV